MDVYPLAKIRILKQITTHRYRRCGVSRCLSSCKDTNFKANHNQRSQVQMWHNDVYPLAKIRILKQITTKSVNGTFRVRCLSSCKDTNFKANHNYCPMTTNSNCDVYPLAKIRILKQITTSVSVSLTELKMFILLQRYEF